jgi:hypothetical protein
MFVWWTYWMRVQAISWPREGAPAERAPAPGQRWRRLARLRASLRLGAVPARRPDDSAPAAAAGSDAVIAEPT